LWAIQFGLYQNCQVIDGKFALFIPFDAILFVLIQEGLKTASNRTQTMRHTRGQIRYNKQAATINPGYACRN